VSTDAASQFAESGRPGVLPYAHRTDSTDSVRLYIEPRSIAELLIDPDFFRVLSTGLVFIQDRHTSARRLVAAMRWHASAQGLEISELGGAASDFGDLRRKLAPSSRHGRRRPSEVVVLDATERGKELSRLIGGLDSSYPRSIGLWVLALAGDTSPRCLRTFDVVFLFDMAAEELDSARTSLPLSERHISDLRAGNVMKSEPGSETVLFFLARDADEDQSLPLPRSNPGLVALRNDEMSRLVPVERLKPLMAQGVRFMSERLGTRAGGTGSSDSETAELGLPIAHEQLKEFAQEPMRCLRDTLDYSAAVMIQARLAAMMRQIDRLDGLIARRNEKAGCAAADDRARIELRNQRDSAQRDREWERMRQLLSRAISSRFEPG
jgi:hypothetical protein